MNIRKLIINNLGVDKAISFTFFTQILGLVRSLVSVLLVTKFLTQTEQGFYYTFTSILAIQIFFELGFSSIITQFTAHEVAYLNWKGNILEGNEEKLSRLNSLLHQTSKWFIVMAFILLITLVLVGFIFFNYSSPKNEVVDWKLPWIFMSITTALSLLVSPLLAFYEGLGKVNYTAKLRFYSLFFTTIVFFAAISLDTKLYAYAITNIMALIISIIWLISTSIKETFIQIWTYKVRKFSISWRKEIFPYQWKLALSWISGYFLFQLFNPILFTTVGAKAAGQMGMTQAIFAGIFGLSNSWFTTKVPIFSNLIAQKKYNLLDNLFNKTIFQSLVVMLICSATVIAILLITNYFHINIIHRFLNIVPFTILGFSSIALFITNAFAIYLRCHKAEPFLFLSVITGILNATTMFFSSKYWGITGMVSGYFIVTLLGLVVGFIIFLNKKKEWHG